MRYTRLQRHFTLDFLYCCCLTEIIYYYVRVVVLFDFLISKILAAVPILAAMIMISAVTMTSLLSTGTSGKYMHMHMHMIPTLNY